MYLTRNVKRRQQRLFSVSGHPILMASAKRIAIVLKIRTIRYSFFYESLMQPEALPLLTASISTGKRTDAAFLKMPPSHNDKFYFTGSLLVQKTSMYLLRGPCPSCESRRILAICRGNAAIRPPDEAPTLLKQALELNVSFRYHNWRKESF